MLGAASLSSDPAMFQPNQEVSLRHLLQQPEDLIFRFFKIGVDFVQWARGNVLVKVTVEVYLIPNLILASVQPGVRNMGEHLPLEVAIYLVIERNVLKIAQVWIRFESSAPGDGFSLAVGPCENAAKE